MKGRDSVPLSRGEEAHAVQPLAFQGRRVGRLLGLTGAGYRR